MKLPKSVIIRGQRYAVRLTCGQLFVRGDDDQAREVNYLLDMVDHTITVCGSDSPRMREASLAKAVRDGERWAE